MLQKINDFISKYSKLIITIIVMMLIAVPFIIFFIWLRGQKKTIVVHPEFKIVDVQDSQKVDLDVLSDAISIGKDVLNKVGNN